MTARDTTSEVEDLYRDYPYPGHGVVSRVVATMLADTLSDVRRKVTGRKPRLLDAGCGTGEQTLGIVEAFPDVDVTGIDLSAASLERARELAARRDDRVTFVRKNLMEPIDDLGRFDVIVSVGTLHHLADPGAGFQHLRNVLEPHGAMLGMVYGTFGKWESFQIRDAMRIAYGDASRDKIVAALRESNLAPNAGLLHYIDVLKRRWRFGPRIPIIEAVRRTVAGRSDTYQADTYTHVQEAVFTWTELDALLSKTGFRFLGWPRRSGMPDEPGQLFRGGALAAVERLSVLEQASIYERLLRPTCLYFLAAPAPSSDGER